MVRRRGLTTAAALLALLAVAPPAHATSAKVAIGDFRWSQPQVTVAAGDSVTWFWVGPDLQHSVTALEPPTGADSDPGDAAPEHAPGDRFSIEFDEPGVYRFHCKLHALVRGTVTVVPDTTLAGPSLAPDPPVVGDVLAPVLSDARWAGAPRAGRPLSLRYTLDEPARVTLDIMRPRRGVDRLVGTRRFAGHIGWNRFDFSRAGRRRLSPGRYYALLVARDKAGNQTADVRVGLRVRR